MCINCQCKKCSIVNENMKNGIWYHFTNNIPLITEGNLLDIFPNDKINSITIRGKPKNVIWCSAGSWLFDPYHDQIHYSNNDVISERVLLIQIY